MKLSNKNIVFVTGGSGSIGRQILFELGARNIRVKALARSQTSANVVSKLGAEPIMGDLTDLASLRAGMAGSSHLIHAAADVGHGVSNQQQDRINLGGAYNVYTAAKEVGVSRAVHISTESVLLNGQPLVNVDETYPIPSRLAGGYSKSKAAAERIALESCADNLHLMIIRPRFVWGLGDTTALPQLISAVQSGKLAWIGGGHYMISTTHLTNAVSGILLSLENGSAGEIYFVSDGEPVEFRDFITRLLATQKIKAPTREVPRWLVATIARLSDLLSRLTAGKLTGPMSWQEYATLGVEVTLNIDKARDQLGYTPVMTIENGLAELAAHHTKTLGVHNFLSRCGSNQA